MLSNTNLTNTRGDVRCSGKVDSSCLTILSIIKGIVHRVLCLQYLLLIAVAICANIQMQHIPLHVYMYYFEVVFNEYFICPWRKINFRKVDTSKVIDHKVIKIKTNVIFNLNILYNRIYREKIYIS
jgi:hypothetical protein